MFSAQPSNRNEEWALSLVSAASPDEIQATADRLLQNAELWDVSIRNPQDTPDLSALGLCNKAFFLRYADIRARFMSLQLGYLARPKWLPIDVPKDLVIVGHTVEQEYLFSRIGEDCVFEMAIDEVLLNRNAALQSLYHAVVFYHLLYGA